MSRMQVPGKKIAAGFVSVFLVLVLGAVLGCSSSSSRPPGGDDAGDQLMMFEASDFTYYGQGEERELRVFSKLVAVSVAEGEMEELEEWLGTDPLVRQPVDVEALGTRNLVLVSLVEGATVEEILALIERLNRNGLTRYASPVFAEPSSRAIVTDEFVARFKDSYSTDEIEDYLADMRVRVLRSDFLWPGCYLLGFTSRSGSNTLEVARSFYESGMVRYADPNFVELLEPPDEDPAAQPWDELLGDIETAQIFHPNLFLEFDQITYAEPLFPPGWETIVEEDFEGLTFFSGWENQDRNASGGLYFWGRVRDADFPNLMGEHYQPEEGMKGWVAGQHDAGSPDRWPDMAQSPEGYAPDMDTWLVYGPFDLSDAFWSRLWFKGVLWAPGTETFGWALSLDGQTWHGYEQAGVGDGRKLSYWWPGWGDHPAKRMLLDLTRVPELGDLTGAEEVYLALYFQSDGTTAPRNVAEDFSFYGVFLDDIVLEKSGGADVPLISSDPLSKAQWALSNQGQSGGVPGFDIRAVAAWDLLESVPGLAPVGDEATGVIVAVLDEGVDLDHEDLNLVEGYDATFDPEDETRPDSFGGANPADAHGTACAGIIGARDNGIGVVGVAPGVRIMPVRIAYSPESGKGWVTSRAGQADGILWAAGHGARVLSNSWGGGFSSDLLEDAMATARAEGCTIVCASGNDNKDYVIYPASYDDTIAVGAMSPCGERKNPDSCDGEWFWGSNYGPELSVVAPGVLIPTTDISGDGGYALSNALPGKSGNYTMSFNGTSSATPHVAGIVAWMLTVNPDLSPDEVQGLLEQTAVDLGEEGFEDETGHGLVNAHAAVLAAAQRRGDLQIVRWATPEVAWRGSAIELSAELSHSGGVIPAGPFQVRMYLSPDTVIDGSDLLFGQFSVTLQPGETRLLEQPLPVSQDLDERVNWNLILTVDSGNQVFEGDEGNNVSVRPMSVFHAPDLQVKPESILFDTIDVGSGAQRSVQISNEGPANTDTLAITGISLSGSAAFELDLGTVPTPQNPLEFENMETGMFYVNFLPATPGNHSGTITITSNDPVEPQKEIPLFGVAAPVAPWLQVTDVPVDFGEAGTFRFFRIRNIGNAELAWEIDTSAQPAWIVQISQTSGTNAPGTTTTVTMTASRNLLPVGPYAWQMPVTSNGGNETVQVTLTVSAQSLSVDPLAIDFGESSTADSFTIQNTGSFVLTWSIVQDFPAWLGADRMSGWLDPLASEQVNLTVSRTGLDPDTYGHAIQIGSNGGSADVEVSMTVPADSVPEVTAGAAPESGAAPLVVRFTADVVGGDPPLAFSWIFGDGGASTEQNPEHTYQSPGTYTAQVTVTDADGDPDTSEVEIRVTEGGAWSRTYGHGDTYAEYHAYGLDRTADGGVIFASQSVFGGAGGYDIWVVRLDEDGNIVWERGLGGQSEDVPRAVIQTSDGGFIVAGESYSFRTGDRYCDAWVVKLTASGGVDWQRTYGGLDYDVFSDVQETFDSQGDSTGYVLAGWTRSFGAGDYDVWAVKLDGTGGIEWQKTYGGNLSDRGRAIQPDPLGGFILTGSTQSFGAGSGDVWLLKLGADGSLEWEKAYGGIGTDSPQSVQPAGDGGYVIGAGTTSFDPAADEDFWALKVDAAGDILWQYTYGGAEEDHLQDLRRTADSGYVMTGWTDSFGEPYQGTVNNDAWVVKIDQAGAIEWEKNYNKPYLEGQELINGPDWAYAIVQTADGGYAVAGDTDWWDWERNSDVWVFKIKSSGVLGCGIEADSDAVRDSSGQVVVTGTNDLGLADTQAVVATPAAQGYESVPDVFTQCGP